MVFSLMQPSEDFYSLTTCKIKEENSDNFNTINVLNRLSILTF